MADNGDGGTNPILPIPPHQRLTGRKQLKDRTRFRLLVACLVAGVAATIIFLAAMATIDWVRLHYPSGLYRRSTSAYDERQVSGLFRICRVEYDNSSVPIIHSWSTFTLKYRLIVGLHYNNIKPL